MRCRWVVGGIVGEGGFLEVEFWDFELLVLGGRMVYRVVLIVFVGILEFVFSV